MRPGVNERAASAAVHVVAERTGELDPEIRKLEPSADVVPFLSANGDPMFDRDVRLMSFAVGLLALLVLLITCTKVSALLTGLAASRRQEIAIRLSLGAARRA
jgi:ABC-type lipoprotein release transport system permease subunit